MRARLERALAKGGVGPDGVVAVLQAHDRAGLFRAAHLPPDEDDPRWLHPGRVLVILLDDAGLRDPAWLALGAGVELARPHLMAPGVATALAREGVVPWPRPERPDRQGAEGSGGGWAMGELSEATAEAAADALDAWTTEAVLLPPEGLALVLADALDHLRHLHLEAPGRLRGWTASAAGTHFLPLAERAGGTLARRFRWWCRRVAPGLAAFPDFDSC